ncbi:MAG: DNA polymerase III subunit delta [Clostridiales bacterium]|nr:DNA polymerase III subunit delta [Clostridiales bacterium]
MAETMTHAFVKIEADIKKNKIGNVVLLHGQEQFLVEWARDRLVGVYVNEAVRTLDLTVFEEDQWTAAQVIEACETIPLFSARKTVVINGLANVWKASGKGCVPKEEADRLAAYLKDLPDTLLLIITTRETEEDRREKKRTALYKAIAENGTVYDFAALGRSDLSKFIRKRFRTAGKEIHGSLVDRLIEQSGYNNKDIAYSLFDLENDVRKIIFHAGLGEITQEDIDLCLSGTLEQGVFKLLDAVSANRKGDALSLLHQLIVGGMKPLRIQSMIAGQLEIMLLGLELRAEGCGMDEIQRRLRVNDYRLKKAMRAAGRYEIDELKRILCSAYAVESEIKSGRLSMEMALEVFIAEI